MLHQSMKSHFLSLGLQAVYGITQSIPSGAVHLVQACILFSSQAGLFIGPKFLAQFCLKCFVLL